MYIIGTKNEDGSPNFNLVTWTTFTMDHSEPHIILSLGGPKTTKGNLLRTRTFSSNLVTADILWLADYFGTVRGAPKSDIPYDFEPGNTVDAPVLSASKFVFECEVSRTHNLGSSDLIFGKVKNIQLDASFDPDNVAGDLVRLDPAIYAPGNYYRIGEHLGKCGQWSEKYEHHTV